MANGETVHGAERLRVYALAVDLCSDVDGILKQSRCSASLFDQTRRAAESVVLNIGEGAAHFSAGRKLYHYQTAHGSIGELTAALARIRRLNPHVNIFRARNNADHIAAMLVGLIHRQQSRQQGRTPK